jgi:DNA mismatch repair ATPase MutL
MPSIKSFNGAVRVLQMVKNGTASRDWIRIIQYSITSPHKIEAMGYTQQNISTLKKMIGDLKKSPKRKSSKRKSAPKRKSSKRKSAPKRKSSKRAKSPKRKSSKRKSSKRKSSKRKSSKRKSSKRKSSKRKSPKRSKSKSPKRHRWQVEGFSKVHSYPFAGAKITGLNEDEIKKMYRKVGNAWSDHTKKDQDLGAADTLSKMKQRLRWFLSNAGEKSWIEYSMNNQEYKAYTNGSKLNKIRI